MAKEKLWDSNTYGTYTDKNGNKQKSRVTNSLNNEAYGSGNPRFGGSYEKSVSKLGKTNDDPYIPPTTKYIYTNSGTSQPSGYDPSALLELLNKLRANQELQARNQYEALLKQSGEQLYQDNSRAARERAHSIKLYDQRRPGNSGSSISNYSRINNDYTNRLNDNIINARAREAGYNSNLQTGLQEILSNYTNNVFNMANQAGQYGGTDVYRKLMENIKI